MAGNKHKIKLGIIGSGLAVRWLHWPALKQMPDKYEIVMACDTNQQTAQETIKLLGGNIAYTADYHELLASDQVEAVLLSLPIELAAPIMLDTVRAGKHALGEKPLAGNWQEAVELVEALKSAKTVVEIAENYRYRSDVRQARQWIEEGKLGQVFLIEIQGAWWTDPNEGFAATSWRQRQAIKYRGGVFGDAVVHQAAALRELGGDVAQVQAYFKDLHPVMAPPDTGTLNLQFKSGAIGNLSFTGVARGSNESSCRATVYGDKGTLYLDSGKVTLQRPDQKPEVFEDKHFDSGYYNEFLNFWEAVVNGAPVISTPEQAMRDWEIIMKALDSAETGQPVRFD